MLVYIVYWTTKNAQKVWSKDLVHEKPFGYRVVDQNSLTSCPGLYLAHDALGQVYCRSINNSYQFDIICEMIWKF